MFESAQGLSWSPPGEEVWVTSPLESGGPHVFTLSGKSRIPLTVHGRLRLMDIDALWRSLLQFRHSRSREIDRRVRATSFHQQAFHGFQECRNWHIAAVHEAKTSTDRGNAKYVLILRCPK